jgi:hypothetical protein
MNINQNTNMGDNDIGKILKYNRHNNKMDRKERLHLAVNYLVENGTICPKEPQKNLAEKTGLDTQSIAGAIDGNELFLTDGFFRKFNMSFENIFSIEWLLNGKGKMLSEEEKQQINQNVNVDGDIIGTEVVCGHNVHVVGISNNDEIECLQRLLGEKDKIIKEKDEKIEELNRKIGQLEAAQNHGEVKNKKIK